MKRLCWCLLPLLGAPLLHAESGYPRFSAELGTGVTGGTTNEIVYADSSGSTKVSELAWPVPPSAQLWTSFGTAWNSWFETNVRVGMALPLATGTMTDDDWNIYDSDGDLLSRVHSDSTAYQTADWQARLEMIVPLRFDGFRSHLAAGLDYRHLSWEAWNPVQTETLASTGAQSSASLSGLGIQFRQEWILFYLGAGAGVTLNGLDWDLDLRVAPFPLDNQTDLHVLRELTFNESLSGGFSVEPTLSVSWPVEDRLKMVASVSYWGAFFLRGDEVVSSDGADASSSSAGFFAYAKGAGSAAQEVSLSLAVRVSL